jgi:hypothetical protein
MIFLDESGVDSGRVTSSAFFVVSIVNLEDYQKENFKIRESFNYKQKTLKWQKFTRIQKDMFFNYAENCDYKIYAIQNNKLKKEATYPDIAYSLFKNLMNKKEVIIYTGSHLNSIFEKIRRKLKKEDGIIIRFRESKLDEELGVEIADLWAGFVNDSFRKHLDLIALKNLVVREF